MTMADMKTKTADDTLATSPDAAPSPTSPRATRSPRVSVLESEDGFQVRAEVPGSSLDDVTIDFEDEILNISARVSHELASGVRWHLQEHRPADYLYRLRLGRDVDFDGISATYSEGVLLLELPKREELKPRRIEVSSTTS